jgi:UDP-GlcNAc3NAcA epimerase
MKIVTIIGARPQFIKAAVLSRHIRERAARADSAEIEEYIVHTGQHYDRNMSHIFFDQLRIPEPDINLEIGGGSHGQMTGRMLERIEEVYLRQKPDAVLVYGDTNSTLAGALAASKLHIPVAHVEAGLRSFNMQMPEEQNRLLTDHISTMLFCPTSTAVSNLAAEGITAGVHPTGDIMYDASLFYRNIPYEPTVRTPDDFYLITLHRAENTDDPQRLRSIVEALNEYKGLKGVLPLHPRTRKMLELNNLSFSDHIQVIEPIGYLDMITLEDNCRFIVTDSGGVQKEAYFFRKPCITLRDQTEWVETVGAGANVIVGADKAAILMALHTPPQPNEWPDLYGKGDTGKQILELLENNL